MSNPEDKKRLDRAVEQSSSMIKHKLMVLSGKGGVGKSTVAVALATGLAMRGYKVGLMDVDIHGPSIPGMMGLKEQGAASEDDWHFEPVAFSENLSVVSIGFYVKSPDEAVIWRGPMKMRAIKQFVGQVAWGELDYLVVDSPPGTGDEPLSVAQCLPGAGAIIVTTPQTVAIADVRRCISFCRTVDANIVGVVENMSGLKCPHCDKEINLFSKGGGARMAQDMEVPFLGSLPIDPSVVEAGDSGRPADLFTSDIIAGAAGKIIDNIIECTQTH